MSRSEVIRSAANPLLKRVRKLRQRKHRDREGVFIVEGIQPVWQALEHDAEVEVILVCEELLSSEAALAMLTRHEAAGAPVTRLSSSAFGSIAEREHPSGLAALVKMSRCEASDLPADPRSLLVALHQVANPGNLGTIMRTLDAVGGSGLILVGESTDPWHPGAVKASMGTLFSTPVCRVPELDELWEWCRARRVQTVTTSATARRTYLDAPFRLPAMALFGSEGEGLSEEALASGDLCVSIPMTGSASSLNLAVSVGVLMYEIRRVVGPS